jgi:hypothetical protein
MEQKLSHAEALRGKLHVERDILVDDITGTGHHLYGKLPNMTYLISRGGRVLFRSDWTDPPTVETALEYILAAREQRREGMRMAPFYAELVGYRWSDSDKHDQVLLQAGSQALEDWRQSSLRRQSQPPRPGRIQL